MRRRQQWPGIAVPLLMSRTGGACFLLGAALVAATNAADPHAFRSTEVAYVAAAIASLLGIAALSRGARLHPWHLQLNVVCATLLIGVTAASAALPSTAVAIAALYAFIAFSAFFMSWPEALAHIAVAAVCCVVGLVGYSDVPWVSAVIVAATVVGMGGVITALGRLVAAGERDAVTGLPNLRGAERILDIEAATADPAVIALRIDGADAARPSASVGDDVAVRVTDALEAVLPETATLARTDRDGFAVVLPGASRHDATAVIAAARAALDGCALTAAVTWRRPDTTSAATLGRADAALRRARRAGVDHTVVDEPRREAIADALSSAITRDEIDVVYQPITALRGGGVVGLEALARWTPADGPSLGIGEVIDVAEEFDLIGALGHRVLRRACGDARWMQERTAVPITLSVNVSGMELVDGGYVRSVLDVLEGTGWAPEKLVLEVTESVIAADAPASIAHLGDLRRRGIRIAVDDFGTGYSSLHRLSDVPADFLKLDASFVADVGADGGTEAADHGVPPLLAAIAAFVRPLAIPVVVEGVETRGQADVLRAIGFDLAQGFLFGPPLPRDDVVTTLAVTPPAARR